MVGSAIQMIFCREAGFDMDDAITRQDIAIAAFMKRRSVCLSVRVIVVPISWKRMLSPLMW